MKSVPVVAFLFFLGMLLGGIGALWLLACFGMLFEPRSSLLQLGGLLASLFGFAAVHAARRRPAVRAVAATLPPTRFTGGRDGLVFLLGTAVIVAFYSPFPLAKERRILWGTRGGLTRPVCLEAWTIDNTDQPLTSRGLRF